MSADYRCIIIEGDPELIGLIEDAVLDYNRHFREDVATYELHTESPLPEATP